MKVLILGHGRYFVRMGIDPRCAPVDTQTWKRLVMENDPKNLVFIDFIEQMEPDILENIGNEWGSNLRECTGTFDYVIDTIGHLGMKQRNSVHFWNGIVCALRDDGTFIGWKNDGSQEKLILCTKKSVEDYMKANEASMFVPNKAYRVYTNKDITVR